MPTANLSESVLGAAFEVANTLVSGFLEKVYERALLIELAARDIQATAQPEFSLTYKGHHIGQYFADIMVENTLLVELKCTDRLNSEHMAQCLNYLRVSSRTTCLLINFQQSKLEWNRIVLSHPSKVFKNDSQT